MPLLVRFSLHFVFQEQLFSMLVFLPIPSGIVDHLLVLFVEGKKGVIMSWAELRRSFFCSAIGSQPPSISYSHSYILALLWDTHNTSSLFWRNNIAQVPEPPDFYLSVNEIASSYDKCQNANHQPFSYEFLS